MTERDWQKDWEAYKKTTPGKWEVEGAGGVHMDGTRDGYFIVVNGRRLNNPYFSHDDAVFIALAHEGWPAALEERMRLSEENQRLQERIEDLEDYYNDALTERRQAIEEYRRLRQENAKLHQALDDYREKWAQLEKRMKELENALMQIVTMEPGIVEGLLGEMAICSSCREMFEIACKALQVDSVEAEMLHYQAEEDRLDLLKQLMGRDKQDARA